MSTDLNLAIIIGSVREGRLGPKVADWFNDRAKTDGRFSVDLIDLKEAGLPNCMVETAEDTPACVTELGARLHAADAFVMVTPEYNRSFPASLKHAIDWYVDEWSTKPVGFVSYGGVSAGLSAVEALRVVMPEVHATTVRDVVCFPNVWDDLDETGALVPGDFAGTAATTLLSRLEWWATALKNHRTDEDYAV